jgi:hypothetical protein
MKRFLTISATAAFALVLLAPAAHAKNLNVDPIDLNSRNMAACYLIETSVKNKSGGKVTCD